MADEARELIEIAHHEGLVSDTEYREWNASESGGKSKGYLDWLESQVLQSNQKPLSFVNTFAKILNGDFAHNI
ncbi:MAG TPA: hypothetical protein PLH19_11425 [Anaerolineae bacterium]|nr:hypothetical protein [Anaerolineae bacterium]HQH39131.1 hypothetical protein [Anaerolineae bacterium]